MVAAVRAAAMAVVTVAVLIAAAGMPIMALWALAVVALVMVMLAMAQRHIGLLKASLTSFIRQQVLRLRVVLDIFMVGQVALLARQVRQVQAFHRAVVAIITSILVRQVALLVLAQVVIPISLGWQQAKDMGL